MRFRLLPLLLLLALLAPCVVAYTLPDGSVVTYKCSCKGEDCGTWNATETTVDNVTQIQCNQEHYTTKAFSYNIDEPITYPQEYYTLTEKSNAAYNYISTMGNKPSSETIGYATQLSAIELRHQTILMERQNELLQEQVNLMKELNKKSLVCVSENMSGQCFKYAWVGGA